MSTYKIILVLILSASLARSGEVTSRALFDEGLLHYNVGEYRKALDSFKAGYYQKADPTFLFNMGQCYRMLGENESAIREYRSFLREQPSAVNRADVERRITEMQARPSPPPTTSNKIVAPEPKAVTATPNVVSVLPAKTHAHRSWKRPAGAVAIAAGALAIAAGASLIAINGRGTCKLEPPAEQCRDVYTTLAPGVALGVGGVMLSVVGAALLVPVKQERVVVLPNFGHQSAGVALTGEF